MQKFIYNLFRFSSSTQFKLNKRVTPIGFGVFCCVVISGILGIDTNQSSTYQAFTFLFSIIIISLIYSLKTSENISATRILPKFSTVDTKLKYRIVIHNKTKKTQIGLKLSENFADPRPNFSEFRESFKTSPNKFNYLDVFFLYYHWVWLVSRKQCITAKTLKLPPLPPNSKTEIMGEITPKYRGVGRLISLTIAIPDPFGFIYNCTTINLPQSLLILPKLYQLPSIQLPGFRKYQSGGVNSASSVGESSEFRSLRDYRPGDSLRKIHWKSWAKTGKPIVKEEQDEFFVRHALILDTFQDQKYSEILEEAISIAASLACEIQTQESLLDLMFVGNEAYCFTFGRGISHTDKMLEILASVVACQDKNFDSIIPVVMERISLLSGCICIFLCWDEDRKKLVNYLQSRNIHTLVLIITDPKNKLENFDLESQSNQLENFHILELGKIQTGLMNI
ncbi:MAG TPA: DUF58 domain-containing protein [Nostocaceae cyanobacterium]|nr:DUF58 domain-containing protein [Nostocaceae cyanobacterium]